MGESPCTQLRCQSSLQSTPIDTLKVLLTEHSQTGFPCHVHENSHVSTADPKFMIALTGDRGAQDHSPQVSLRQEAAVAAVLSRLEAHKIGFATRCAGRARVRPGATG
ncbi:hypothetical protein NDU88_010413 [Pleurodeles waltl]|uniref:Uncharacterized protein n=1 Tax=Pleurodeles waltl TaxID=8319 RepID=A0AAV7S3X6_PLEWA|nr:hypothetical protein NDU88_010413 [Pleurodeles waltl]